VNDEIAGRWEELAVEYNARLRLVECVCSDDDEHRRRVEGRRRGIPGWHEVGWDHVERMRSEYPQLDRERLTLDAMDSLSGNLLRVGAYIRRT
jgi:hypothetical protein